MLYGSFAQFERDIFGDTQKSLDLYHIEQETHCAQYQCEYKEKEHIAAQGHGKDMIPHPPCHLITIMQQQLINKHRNKERNHYGDQRRKDRYQVSLDQRIFIVQSFFKNFFNGAVLE